MVEVSPMRVQQYIAGLQFPASTGEVIAYAGQSGADEDVLDALRSLPDESFQTPSEVGDAIEQLGNDSIAAAAPEDDELDNDMDLEEEDGDI